MPTPNRETLLLEGLQEEPSEIRGDICEEQQYVGLVDMTRQNRNLLANLEVLDLDDRKCWYPRGFNRAEKAIIKGVIMEILATGTPLDEIKIMEFGPGTGRVGKLIMEVVQELTGNDSCKIERVAKNLHSIELIDRCLTATRDTLAPYGAPRANHRKGDFTKMLPENLGKGQFDLVLAPRNNLFYCVDAEEREGESLENTMRNVNDLLKPGGFFLFDTVDIRDDLTHLYTNLVRMHSEATGLPNPKMLFRDRDALDREDYYFRRVITIGEMRQRSQLVLEDPVPLRANPTGITRSRCEEIGNLWIEMYNMKEWLQAKSLRTFKRQGDLSARQILEGGREFMETIPVDLVEKYTKLFYRLRKPRSTLRQI